MDHREIVYQPRHWLD